PRYGSSQHCRTGEVAVCEARPAVLVEGFNSLHEAEPRRPVDQALFLDRPAEVHLARLIARDTGERGRTRRSVLSQFEATVRGAHAAYVEPTKAFADLVLFNVGRVDRVAETAAGVVRERLARRGVVEAA